MSRDVCDHSQDPGQASLTCDRRRPLGMTHRRSRMKVNPFYSKLPGTSVYHDNNQCTEGKNIEAKNRESGTGGMPKCDHCKRL